MKEHYNNLDVYSEKEKYANKQQWFKEYMQKIDRLSIMKTRNFILDNENSTKDDKYYSMRINYDLYNNKIHKEDFLKFCSNTIVDFEFPTNFVNENIITEKIKVLEGIELARPFHHKVIAVNPEATTRKEEEYFKKYREWVVSQIMTGIQQQVVQEQQAKTQGQQLSKEDQVKIQQEIEQQVQAMTPDEVKRYMERKYQDPAEVMNSQLLTYLMKKLSLKNLFNENWKLANITGYEIYRIYIEDNDLRVKIVKPFKFDFDNSRDNSYIENGEWTVAEYYYSMTDIIREFPEFTDKELNEINDQYGSYNRDTFYFDDDLDNNNTYIPVTHYTWKSTRKIGFLKYIDKNNGELLEKIVSEDYKLQPNYGDIEIEWRRIPEAYEGWCIGADKYAKMRKVQYIRDIDSINDVKLPYIGIQYDDGISLVERMKSYQYLYDIIINKIRSLMASDKGKLLLMNVGLIPRSQGIDTAKWLEYASMLNIGFFNPHEEGNKILDVNAAAKVLDLSLTSDIQKYIQLSEYIERRCGESVGIVKQVEGRIGTNEAVSNTQQSIQQSSFILEPYFALHNIVKRNVLEYILDLAKLAYSRKPKLKLSFVLDDLSNKILTIDREVLLNNVMGIFISETSKPDELKQNIVQLAHAALQNQKAEFSDIIKILKTDNPTEAEEILELSESKAREFAQQMQQQQIQADKEQKQEEMKFEMAKLDKEGEWDIKKEEERRKTAIQKQAILSVGFNEDKDFDKDGQLDVMEIAQKGINAEIIQRQQTLEEKKFEHQKEVDNKKLELEKKKIAKDKNK